MDKRKPDDVIAILFLSLIAIALAIVGIITYIDPAV